MIGWILRAINLEKGVQHRVHFVRDKMDRRGLLIHNLGLVSLVINFIVGTTAMSDSLKLYLVPFFSYCLYQFITCAVTCASMDPGYITQKTLDQNVKDAPLYASHQSFTDPVPECGFCCYPKPVRSHHCGTCDLCVERFDHHCPYLDNCIGANNFPYFFKSNMYAFAMEWLALSFWLKSIINKSVFTSFNINRNIFSYFVLVLTAVYQLGGSIFNARVFFRTVYLTFRGQTLVEKKKKINFGIKPKDAYKLFLGKNWAWFLIRTGKR
ncbi:Palmitoyltransferase [Hexamita inflata]|uniref:Palmitoyltransferase n=1 Tax=Hexamita inflata TaxID=28002 RepID=A0AA86P5T1_9EUKA|nr:Palmitoyltransferase [Hexamita inflata]